MPIRSSRYYHNPEIGAALEGIASIIGPPDAGDTANYALARERNQRSDIVKKLSADPRYQDFDYQAIMADLYDPTSSLYAVDQGNATTRRGQDITAATSRLNNAADNTRQFATEMFQPLNEGQVRPAVPADISSLFDVPMALPQAAGAPKPRTESEVQGGLLERAILDGLIGPEDAAAKEKSSINVENVVGAGGSPKIVTRADAVGHEPYFNKGADAKPTNGVAQLKDGTTVAAVQGADGVWKNAQTGAVLPPDIQIFDVPKPQGSSADVGLGQPARNYIDRALIDIETARGTAVKLRDLIQTSPASQGAVGFLRGTAQDVIQVGGELGQYFGGGVSDVAKAIDDGLADASLAGAFDPSIPAIDMLSNLLAFQYAKTTTGERLSNEMLRAARAALGLDGPMANQASAVARLNQAIEQMGQQQETLQAFRSRGVDALNSGTGGEAPSGWDPEDWAVLTPEEQQQVLDGRQ